MWQAGGRVAVEVAGLSLVVAGLEGRRRWQWKAESKQDCWGGRQVGKTMVEVEGRARQRLQLLALYERSCWWHYYMKFKYIEEPRRFGGTMYIAVLDVRMGVSMLPPGFYILYLCYIAKRNEMDNLNEQVLLPGVGLCLGWETVSSCGGHAWCFQGPA